MQLAGLADKIRGLSQAIIDANKTRLQTIAANEMEFLVKRRVFLNGKDTAGNEIGKYSTKESYVNPAKLPATVPKAGFKIRGKDPKRTDTLANGTKRKTAYLSQGYKALKEAANFEGDNYNLTLTGASRDSVKVGTKGDDVVFGYSSSEKQIILQAHEKRLRKNILKPSKDEIEEVNERIHNELKLLVKDQIQQW